MSRSRFFYYAIVVLVVMLTLIFLKSVQVRANKLQFIDSVEKEKIIEAVITQVFFCKSDQASIGRL